MNGATVGDLIENDADGDGVQDWEEILRGLDPTKAETVPGVPDGSTVAKMKESYSSSDSSGETITETDKFSRELLATITSLSQNGAMDDTAIEKISDSLVEHVKNSPPDKVYVLEDLIISEDNSKAAIKKFNDALENIDKKYPMRGNISEVLKKFIVDENNVDVSALEDLDPIIAGLRARMNAVLGLAVPRTLAPLHLKFLNSAEKLIENIEDLKMYDQDPILSFSAMIQYEQNLSDMLKAAQELTRAINQKLSSL